MAKKLFLLTVILSLFSCGGGDEAIPEGILNQEEMVGVMIDIRMAEGMISSVNMSLDSSRQVYRAMEKRIFEKHGLDSAGYVKSYNYYMLHPQLFLDITDIVIDSLKARNSKQYSTNY